MTYYNILLVPLTVISFLIILFGFVEYITHILMTHYFKHEYSSLKIFSFSIKDFKNLIKNMEYNLNCRYPYETSLFYLYTKAQLRQKLLKDINIWSEMGKEFKFHASLFVYNDTLYILTPWTYFYIYFFAKEYWKLNVNIQDQYYNNYSQGIVHPLIEELYK